jgi:hypothetical protein
MREDYQKEANKSSLIARLLYGLLGGCLLGACIYKIAELKGIWLFAIAGALLGGFMGLCWQIFTSLWMRFRSDDWQIAEIEIVTLGQKWKLANSGAQRRVAWSIFVEAVTRIATQPMSDQDGDDGVALKSLYDLFQSTRKSINEMDSIHVLPSRRKHLDTVETYALAMLNQDLRPFLSKWHPLWDIWRKANPDTACSHWDLHTLFRDDLKILQPKIRDRAQGLGKIAGVSDIARFMNITAYVESNDQD